MSSNNNLPSITVSFLSRDGSLPQRSGLNWGQRPEENRESNQAYIRLPVEIYRSGFFPSRGELFNVRTDDRHSFVCVRRQDNGKAIHTPSNNSIIGIYFRNRLGVPSGEPITLHDLLNYGRTDVTFYRINNQNYIMDFSV